VDLLERSEGGDVEATCLPVYHSHLEHDDPARDGHQDHHADHQSDVVLRIVEVNIERKTNVLHPTLGKI